jgi:hypothetical protein
MTRKIVSFKTSEITNIPGLEQYPVDKFLSDGTLDKQYVQPDLHVQLISIFERTYFSFHEDYTDEILESCNADYKIETELDGNFTNTLIHQHWDLEELYSLGCPEYDPEVHILVLNTPQDPDEKINLVPDVPVPSTSLDVNEEPSANTNGV